MGLEVKGADTYRYDNLRTQAGQVSIVADDVMAPDDDDLRAVLAAMQQRIRDDQAELEFRVGRFTVTIQPQRGGGLPALIAAAARPDHSHGQTKPVTPE